MILGLFLPILVPVDNHRIQITTLSRLLLDLPDDRGQVKVVLWLRKHSRSRTMNRCPYLLGLRLLVLWEQLM